MLHLVERAAAGDDRAFEELMQATTRGVRTVLRQYARRDDDVRDLTQEVFLRALQRLQTLDDPERFTAWLYAIARNAGLDHVRRIKRAPALLSTAVGDEATEVQDSDAGPD